MLKYVTVALVASALALPLAAIQISAPVDAATAKAKKPAKAAAKKPAKTVAKAPAKACGEFMYSSKGKCADARDKKS